MRNSVWKRFRHYIKLKPEVTVSSALFTSTQVSTALCLEQAKKIEVDICKKKQQQNIN